ncbi:MAG: hypothetical protein ABIO45_06205 [Burkholderiaceae bacterium]
MTGSLEAVEAGGMQFSVQERAELIEHLIDTMLPAPADPSMTALMA